MANKVQTLRSSTAGARPTGRKPGELYVNFADKALGYVDAAGQPVDIQAPYIFELPNDPSEVTDPANPSPVDFVTTWANLATKPTGKFIVHWKRRFYKLKDGMTGANQSDWDNIGNSDVWDWGLMNVGDTPDFGITHDAWMAKRRADDSDPYEVEEKGDGLPLILTGNVGSKYDKKNAVQLNSSWQSAIQTKSTYATTGDFLIYDSDMGYYYHLAGRLGSDMSYGELKVRTMPPPGGGSTVGLGAAYAKARADLMLDDTSGLSGTFNVPVGNMVLKWGTDLFLRVNGMGEADSDWVWLRSTTAGSGFDLTANHTFTGDNTFNGMLKAKTLVQSGKVVNDPMLATQPIYISEGSEYEWYSALTKDFRLNFTYSAAKKLNTVLSDGDYFDITIMIYLRGTLYKCIGASVDGTVTTPIQWPDGAEPTLNLNGWNTYTFRILKNSFNDFTVEGRLNPHKSAGAGATTGTATAKKQLVTIAGNLTPHAGNPATAEWFSLAKPSGIFSWIKDAADTDLFVFDGNHPKATKDAVIKVTFKTDINDSVGIAGELRKIHIEAGVVATPTSGLLTGGVNNGVAQTIDLFFMADGYNPGTIEATWFFKMKKDQYFVVTGIQHTKGDNTQPRLATAFHYDIKIEEL